MITVFSNCHILPGSGEAIYVSTKLIFDDVRLKLIAVALEPHTALWWQAAATFL